MSCPKILIQLDPDKQASSFDAIVAADAGVDHLLQYSLVEPSDVAALVHGAMFTRGPAKLQNTAIFIGGTDVSRAESLLAQVVATFFGPLHVSVMMDPNGANTTAAAAVVLAGQHLDLSQTSAIVLAGTGPVGERAALLLARGGSQVRLASRQRERAASVCERIQARLRDQDAVGAITPVQVDAADAAAEAAAACQLIISAGAAGVETLSLAARRRCPQLRVAIDLNAVPPLGIAGTQVHDRAEVRDGVICYGAIGVGATKMNIHRAALQRLFTAHDLVLDAEEMFELGCGGAGSGNDAI